LAAREPAVIPVALKPMAARRAGVRAAAPTPPAQQHSCGKLSLIVKIQIIFEAQCYSTGKTKICVVVSHVLNILPVTLKIALPVNDTRKGDENTFDQRKYV